MHLKRTNAQRRNLWTFWKDQKNKQLIILLKLQIYMLTTSIAEGFSLLRQVVQLPAQPSYCMPYEARRHNYSHTPSLQSVHPNQAFHSFSNNLPSVRGTKQNATSTINIQDASHSSNPAGLTGFSYTQALFSDD